MTIIVFTKNGESIPSFPDRPGLEYRHVEFSSTNFDDLMYVAKYRIINFPTSVIIDDKGKLLMKVKGAIPNTYLDNILK